VLYGARAPPRTTRSEVVPLHHWADRPREEACAKKRARHTPIDPRSCPHERAPAGAAACGIDASWCARFSTGRLGPPLRPCAQQQRPRDGDVVALDVRRAEEHDLTSAESRTASRRDRRHSGAHLRCPLADLARRRPPGDGVERGVPKLSHRFFHVAPASHDGAGRRPAVPAFKQTGAQDDVRDRLAVGLDFALSRLVRPDRLGCEASMARTSPRIDGVRLCGSWSSTHSEEIERAGGQPRREGERLDPEPLTVVLGFRRCTGGWRGRSK
jgi:hypothetical protein